MNDTNKSGEEHALSKGIITGAYAEGGGSVGPGGGLGSPSSPPTFLSTEYMDMSET